MAPNESELPDISRRHRRSEELRNLLNKFVEKISIANDSSLGFMRSAYLLLSGALETCKSTRNADTEDVIHLLLSRAMHTHRAIEVLLSSGCQPDAIALMRNLIETTLTVRYVATDDSGGLARRFRDYQHVERAKNIDKQIKIDSNIVNRLGAGDVAITRQRASEFRKLHQGKTRHWHGLEGGLAALAAHPGVDMESDYIRGYSIYCLAAHPTYLSKGIYTTQVKDGTAVSWAPTASAALQLSCLATECILNVVETTSKYLGSSSPHLRNVLAEVKLNLFAQGEGGKFKIGNIELSVAKGAWGVVPKEHLESEPNE